MTSQAAAGGSGDPAVVTAPVQRFLVFGVALIGMITVLGLVWLWPTGSELPGQGQYLGEGMRVLSGTVVEAILDETVLDAADNPSWTLDNPGSLLVRLAGSGELVEVWTDQDMPASRVPVGSRVRILAAPTYAPEGNYWGQSFLLLDFNRSIPLAVLGLVFVCAVIAVARWKGLAALVGLAVGILTVWVFTIPALMVGRSPLLVALLTATFVMFVVVYLAHGVSLKSTAALLSTLVSICFVTLIGWYAMSAAHIMPELSGDFRELDALMPVLNLRGVLLCGMVLAGVGVLNDVTITQAATVWELRAASPTMSRQQIARAGMRIGQDHIASSVYTMAFAYVGTSLALLLITRMIDHSAFDYLNLNEVAQELVATSVTSIGLVLAIPLSTVVAAALISKPAPLVPISGPMPTLVPPLLPAPAVSQVAVSPVPSPPILVSPTATTFKTRYSAPITAVVASAAPTTSVLDYPEPDIPVPLARKARRLAAEQPDMAPPNQP